eukprot:g5525.t1
MGILLLAAPYADAQDVVRCRSTGGRPPLSWFAMLANGFLWAAYGATSDWDLTIIVPNAVGVAAGGYYSVTFSRYSSGVFDIGPYWRGVAAMMAGVAAAVAMLSAREAQRVLGGAGCLISVAMFGGPLQVMASVVAQRSTRDLSLRMALATTANCGLWFLYCLMVTNDPFGYVPNGLGLLSGLVQLALFVRFGISLPPKAPPAKLQATAPAPVTKKKA